MLPPHWLKMGEVLSAVPTHTATESCGVPPIIQASLLLPESPICAVPVLAIDGRPPAKVLFDQPAIGCIASMTLSATWALTRRSLYSGSNS